MLEKTKRHLEQYVEKYDAVLLRHAKKDVNFA